MKRGRLRDRKRSGAILFAAMIVVLLGGSPASAHSRLERSEPPNGGMIAIGRSRFTLWFSGPVSAGSSSFDLHTLEGVHVPVTVSASEADGAGFVEIETPPLDKATYVLDWAVISPGDGHPTNGSVLFGVATRPVVIPSDGVGSPDSGGLLLRWLELSALILVIGAMAVSGRVLRSMGAVGTGPIRRARSIALLAAGAAVVAGVITPFFVAPHAGDPLGTWIHTAWVTLTGTPWGHVWLAREAGLVIVTLALWARATRADGPILEGTVQDGSAGRGRVAPIALAVVVGLESWAGHASALPRGSGPAALASAAHLTAAGVWAGGLTVLALCLIPTMRRNPDARGPMLATAWRTFSPMAAVATVVLIASGLYESGRHLPDLHSLASTLYGRAVTGKVLLLVLALTLAGLNTLLVNPRLAAPVGRMLRRPIGWAPVSLHRFTAVVAAEVVILIVAVATAALLTSVPTSREIGTVATTTVPDNANVDGLFLTIEQVPAGANQTRLIVRARSTVKPELAPISGIDVMLVAPTGATTDVLLSLIEPGRYEAELPRLAPGVWQASVAVHRGELPVAVARTDWTIDATTPLKALPLEVATTILAVVLLVGLAGVIGVARRRRVRPTVSNPLVDERTGGRRT